MPKYGRGLNREIVGAVNLGLISEPFSIGDIRKWINKYKDWQSRPTGGYINVTLANATSDKHSETYKKYFVCVDRGLYKLRSQYKGEDWR